MSARKAEPFRARRAEARVLRAPRALPVCRAGAPSEGSARADGRRSGGSRARETFFPARSNARTPSRAATVPTVTSSRAERAAGSGASAQNLLADWLEGRRGGRGITVPRDRARPRRRRAALFPLAATRARARRARRAHERAQSATSCASRRSITGPAKSINACRTPSPPRLADALGHHRREYPRDSEPRHEEAPRNAHGAIPLERCSGGPMTSDRDDRDDDALERDVVRGAPRPRRSRPHDRRRSARSRA